MEPKEIVRRGYDALSYRYRGDAEQPALLGRIGRWLRPGGWLLATTGQRAWTGTVDGWLGGKAPMWWSHADAATYRKWIEQAGLSVVIQEVVPEGDAAHALFWARRQEGTATVRGRRF